MVFLDNRLQDIAAEFNRYNRKPQIRVDGSSACETLLTGVFDANDPGSMLLFIKSLGGLEVERRPDEIVIRSRE
jgi:transmembrane sensor